MHFHSFQLILCTHCNTKPSQQQQSEHDEQFFMFVFIPVWDLITERRLLFVDFSYNNKTYSQCQKVRKYFHLFADLRITLEMERAESRKRHIN